MSAADLADGTVDLLVVGGGVAGCGVALDAVSRGLSVALVEAGDLGSGTSSRSSKLVHGGVRYLEQFRFGLVRQALRERKLLQQRLAPHLVTGLPFLFPLTRRVAERAYVGAGLALYDALAGRTGLPRHRHLTRAGALAVAPALDPARITGAVRYHDGRVDDARLTVALAVTAAQHGARIAVGTEAVSLRRENGTIRVGLRDARSGGTIEARARRVVTAAGPWTTGLYARWGLPAPPTRTSKGVHLVVDGGAIEAESAVITRTAHSVLFLIPWHGRWLVGTTDTPWDGPPERAVADRSDVDYLLAQANRVLARPLRDADVLATFAGLRPLVGGVGNGGNTPRLSREHSVREPAPGVFALIGGKLTTYRVMARDAVDIACRGLDVPASRTHRLPLVGADGYHERARLARRAAALAPDLPAEVVTGLLQRYGDQTLDLLALASDRPGLRRPLPGAPGHLRAEVLWAVRAEYARTVGDVLLRRTRIALETPDHGRGSARAVAALMAEECGWGRVRITEEVDNFCQDLRREHLPARTGSAARKGSHVPR